MEENAVLERLCLFGLTRQEANIYLCLYQYGELTGYEVAKDTGISRSNVYSALSGLVDKGAAYLVEGNANKYIAVPIEEFCENKIRSLNKEREYLIQNIPDMKRQEIGYITIEGYRNIWDKIVNMLNSAEKRIYISASDMIIKALEAELINVVRRNIKLVLLTDGQTAAEEIYKGSTCYLCENRGKSIRVIIDSQYALTGALTGDKNDTCLYTGQENFIDVFKEALSNEMKLITITQKERNIEQ